MIRVPAPEPNDMEIILKRVSINEKFPVPDSFINNLVLHSDGNIRAALLNLQ